MNENLKVGDIVNFSWKANSWWLRIFWKLQRTFDRTKSVHSALYIGDNKLLEMNTKLEIRNIGNISASKNVRLLRVKTDKTEKDVLKAVEQYVKNKGGLGLSYPEYELVEVGINTFFEGFLDFVTGKDVNIPIIADGKADICSTLVSEVWKLAGVDLQKGKNVTPGDLERSNKTYIIKDYKDVI